VEDGGYGWKYESFAAVIQPYLLNNLFRFFPPQKVNNFSGNRDILKLTAPDCFHYNQHGYALGEYIQMSNLGVKV
jgi:hypothetical protein